MKFLNFLQLHLGPLENGNRKVPFTKGKVPPQYFPKLKTNKQTKNHDNNERNRKKISFLKIFE